MQRKTAILLGIVVFAIALAAATAGSGSVIRKAFFAEAMPVSYFAAYDHVEASLYPVSGTVFAFERGFNRSMVVRSSEGLAVIDTFNEDHAKALKGALDQAFPGQPVRWVLLSHNHLDHIRGSDVFDGAEFIGHKDINTLVADFPEAGATIAGVTRALEGDATLQLGDVTVEALFMPFSHSHTLYGFHVPSAGVVYAPDMMFVKALPPFDFPDFYYPGYVRALDRLIGLSAAHYVPSHAARGTRDDLMAYRDMTVEFNTVVRGILLERGVEAATDGDTMQFAVRTAYDQLQPMYGDWHGFNEMFVPKFGRHFGGTYLGY